MARMRYDGQVQRFKIRAIENGEEIKFSDFPPHPERLNMAFELKKLVEGYLASWPKYLRPVPNIDLWAGLHKEGLRSRGFGLDSDRTNYTLRDILALGLLYIDSDDDMSGNIPRGEWFGLDYDFMNELLVVYLYSHECRLAAQKNAFFFPILYTLSTSDQEYLGRDAQSVTCIKEVAGKNNHYTLSCGFEQCQKFRCLRSSFKRLLRDKAVCIQGNEARKYHLFMRYNATKWVILRVTIEKTFKVVVHIFNAYHDYEKPICPRVHKYVACIGSHIGMLELLAGVYRGADHQYDWANNLTPRDVNIPVQVEVDVARHQATVKRTDIFSCGHWALGQFLALMDTATNEQELYDSVKSLQIRGVSYISKLMLVDLCTGHIHRNKILP